MIFSHYRYFDELQDDLNPDWCEREHVCYVWQKGHRLPQKDLQRCMEGLIELERKKHSLAAPTLFLE